MPITYDAKICNGSVVLGNRGDIIIEPSPFESKLDLLILEKFDGNVWSLIMQGSNKNSTSVISVENLVRLFQLCWAVGQEGIINGDIKLDNFLYKFLSDSKPVTYNKYDKYHDPIHFVMNDFGVAARIAPPKDLVKFTA